MKLIMHLNTAQDTILIFDFFSVQAKRERGYFQKFGQRTYSAKAPSRSFKATEADPQDEIYP